MNMQWLGGVACPIVEFHELRFGAGGAERYLGLLDSALSPALMAAGGRDFGHFHLAGTPNRLLIVRGYPSMPARRRALAAFHRSPNWREHRADAEALVQQHDVMLTRIVAPAAGLTALRPGQGYGLMISELRFEEAVGNFHLWTRLLLRKAGLDPLASFATLAADNDVAAVPVICNRTHHVALIPLTPMPPALPPELATQLRTAPRHLMMQPALSLVW